jgi:hypothetical protein
MLRLAIPLIPVRSAIRGPLSESGHPGWSQGWKLYRVIREMFANNEALAGVIAWTSQPEKSKFSRECLCSALQIGDQTVLTRFVHEGPALQSWIVVEEFEVLAPGRFATEYAGKLFLLGQPDPKVDTIPPMGERGESVWIQHPEFGRRFIDFYNVPLEGDDVLRRRFRKVLRPLEYYSPSKLRRHVRIAQLISKLAGRARPPSRL